MNNNNFKLDEELKDYQVGDETHQTIDDDHEDTIGRVVDLTENEFNKKYGVNPRVKSKPELRDQNIILSVRHLKQFFFFGKFVVISD